MVTVDKTRLVSAMAMAMVLASGTNAHAESPSAPAADAPPQVNIEEIIVTARKKSETLQDVPVTVTALTGDTLGKYNVNKVEGITGRVPTLQVQVGGSGSGGQISLRGVGSSSFSAAFDSAVSIDMDGVQISTARILQSAFFDNSQIEVLKGPQSLFFGKSASAGVVSLKSADPTASWQGAGKLGYDVSEHAYLANAYISGPLTETLGIRVAGQYTNSTRYVTLQQGTPTANGPYRGLKDFIGRVTLAWQPSASVRANLKVQYARSEGKGAIGRSDIDCGANGVADPLFVLQGAVVAPAGYNCVVDGKPFLPDIAAPMGANLAGSAQANASRGVPFSHSDLWFGRFRLDVDLSEKLSFASTTGYTNLNSLDLDSYSYGGVGPAFSPLTDILGTPFSALAPALAAVNRPGMALGLGGSDALNLLSQFSQEVRFTTKFSGPFNFMVGGYYENRRNVLASGQSIVALALITPDPVTGYTSDYFKRLTTKGDAISAFISGTYNVLPELELAGGVRYTKENKRQSISVPYVSALLADGFVPSNFFTQGLRFSDSNFSPELSVRYKFTPDVSAYASLKTGFKSGGIDNSALPSAGLLGLNSSDPAVVAAASKGLVFRSESSKGGEIGLKSKLADRTMTLNASLFYYEFKNLQVQTFDAVKLQFSTQNVGKLVTAGAEVNWSWNTPLPGLQLSSNIAYTSAKFTAPFITDQGEDLHGRDAPRAPRLAGNLAADLAVPVGQSYEFLASGNANYSGKYFTDLVSRADIVQHAYVTLDGSVSFGMADGRWKLALVGNNLTNKMAIISSGYRPFLSPGGAAGLGIPAGDDKIVNLSRGRQLFIELSAKF